MGRSVILRSVLVSLLAAACAKPPSVELPPAQATFDEKVEWILRLENQRVLRDEPNPPRPRTSVDDLAGSVDIPLPSLRERPDLLVLLTDPEPQLRRRAALAIGRVGLQQGVEPLLAALGDPEVEVRQISAFALGLIGSPLASGGLVEALNDPEPAVQGRSAEALGRIGAVESVSAIGMMVARHLPATFVLEPEDESYPLFPAVEAFRLGVYALGELGVYEPLADVVLQENGQPILWWWPVAYALQRTGDPRAAEALATLVGVQGNTGVAFAAQGLGALGDPSAIEALAALLDLDRRDEHVVVSAVRALGRIDDSESALALREFAMTRALSPVLRLEALNALSAQTDARATDLFIELITHRWPPIRAAALKALARSDSDSFMLVLAGMGGDPDWRVRAALAEALAHVETEAATFRLRQLLEDEDSRVIPHALEALAGYGPSETETLLLDNLEREDPVVRKAAARLLGALEASASSAVAGALARAFQRAQADTTYLARASIVEALAQFEGTDAEATLAAALADSDWAVRLKAADAIRTRDAGTEVIEAIRPAPVRNAVDFSAPRLVRPSVSPHVYVETERGTIELELNVIDAPVTADSFAALARRGFYDGLTFHRVVPNYMVQGGDPRHDTEGGPGYTLRDELNQVPFLRGTVGLARDWADTGGSQFFITLSPQPSLDGRYTAFAKVIAGMDVVDQLQQGDRIDRVLVWDGSRPFQDKKKGGI